MSGVEPGPFAEVDAIVGGGAGSAFPGGVVAVGVGGRLVHLQAFGRLSYDAGASDVRPDTLYDLASLTKVVRHDDARHGAARRGPARPRRVRPLLLPALPRSGQGPRERPAAAGPHGRPGVRGRRSTGSSRAGTPASSGSSRWTWPTSPERARSYSDLGFILLGDILERLAGAPLDALARARVLDPLGMHDTRLLPPPALRAPDRADRERPVARPRAARRGARRERLRDGRGRRARGPLRQRAGPRPARADAARRRHPRRAPPRVPGDRGALHRAGRHPRRHACPGLGHAGGRVAEAQLGSGRARLLVGRLAAVAALVRPHRLHRHLAVGGPAARPSTWCCSRTASTPRARTTASGPCARASPTPSCERSSDLPRG